MADDFKRLMEAERRRRKLFGREKVSPEEDNRRNIMLKVVIAAIFAMIFTSLHWEDAIDGAYVSFVCAKNFAAGNGLTFAPGEKIETSGLLWMLALWLGGYAMPIPEAAQGFGFLIGAINVVLVYFVAKNSGLKKATVLPAALFATDLYVSIWNVEGIETPFYTMTVLMALLIYLKGSSKSLWVLPALLATMTSPAGFIVAAGLFAHRAFEIARKEKAFGGGDAISLALFVAGFGAYTAFRHSYFAGETMPLINDSPAAGLKYIFTSLWGLKFGAVFTIPFAAIGLWMAFNQKAKPDDADGLRIAPVSFLIAAQAIIIAIAGGDSMPNGRLLVPALPLLYVLSAAGLSILKNRNYEIIAAVVLIAANVFAQSNYGRNESFEKNWSRKQSTFAAPVTDWLKKQNSRGKSAAFSDAGYISWSADVHAISTRGEAVPKKARVKTESGMTTDVNYILSKKPDLIAITEKACAGGLPEGRDIFDREIIKSAQFAQDYFYAVPINGYETGDCKFTYKIYKKKLEPAEQN